MTDDGFDARLGRVQRALSVDRGIVAKLEAVSAIAVRTIEGCDRAGMAMEMRGTTRSLAITDEVVLEVDLVQYDTGEGPCLQAIRESQVIRFDILEPDSRWEHFAPGALARGIQSVLSMPLIASGNTVGALNLYSESRRAFDDDAEALARPLADYAAAVISTSPLYAYSLDLLDELLDELADRELVSTAMGIIQAREGCCLDEAKRQLAEIADRYGEPIRGAAEWVLREQQLSPRLPLDGDVPNGEKG
jgi:GAF domain-containing protein